MITQFLCFQMRIRSGCINTEVTKSRGVKKCKKAAFQPLFRVIRIKCFYLFLVGLLEHRHLVNVERAIIQLAGNSNVMSFMPLQCILIVYTDDALVFF